MTTDDHYLEFFFCNNNEFIFLIHNYKNYFNQTLGNHEFDHGVKGLVPFLEQINFPMVVANLNISDSHPLMQTHSIKHSVTFHFNGTQIGVIGYLLPGVSRFFLKKKNT